MQPYMHHGHVAARVFDTSCTEVHDDFIYTASITIPTPLVYGADIALIMTVAASAIRRIPPVIPAWVPRSVATVRNIVPGINAVRMSDCDIVAHCECRVVSRTGR